MTYRVRKSHIYLLIVLSLFAIGWSLTSRFDLNDVKLKPPYEPSKFHVKSTKIPNTESIDTIKTFNKNSLVKRIDCLINNEYTINCIKDSDQMVYVPFNFLRKYFEIIGRISKKSDGSEVFIWEHSYSKIYYPREQYNSLGSYLWFENYNVAIRDRVKCLSGIHGVPISTQWDSQGHFYPIQIAQFGLSHYSKNLTSNRPRISVLEDGNFKQINWLLAVEGNKIRINSMDDVDIPKNKVLLVEGELISFKLKKKKLHNDLVLSLRVKPMSNFSFTVTLRDDSGPEYRLRYDSIDQDFIDSQPIYGIGSSFEWKHITRDLGIDLIKAFAAANKKINFKIKSLRMTRISFRGKALIDDVTLASSAHETHFKAAAKWLLENQDDNGGWPIQVTRKLSSGSLILEPGWYSAMAQGQAISLLTRMYHHTQDESYFNAALNALSLFNIDYNRGGVRAYFFDKHVWYEEYPTNPSIFVLNGFIYSLFGLYDFKMSCAKHCEEASKLFEEGINSLRKLLPLFDTGFGTLYDLRHLSLKIAPNIARWDYHTTHINQILFLNTLYNDQYFQNTTKRWIGYMKGNKAPHN